jgi:hypothetical protein
MSSQVAITRLVGTTPPTFDGNWNGARLTITLDNSAVLKLEGLGRHESLPTILGSKFTTVARAVERLIVMRQIDPGDHATVTVSALDFD